MTFGATQPTERAVKSALCRRCGQPTRRAMQARYCLACYAAVKREATHRYGISERGRERRRINSQTPAHKVWEAAWYDRNRDRILANQRAARARRRALQRRVVVCLTILCGNRFIRTKGQGHKQFCNACALAHRGKWYVRKRTPELAA